MSFYTPEKVYTISTTDIYLGDNDASIFFQRQASVYLTSPTIRVVVGEGMSQKVFFVHERLICPRSEFFRNALKPQRRRAEDCRVDLRREDPAKFAWYLEILYVRIPP
jgi:hypothetical protein